MKKFIRSFLVNLLAVIILLNIHNPVNAKLNDTSQHWAETQIEKGIELGWVKGYEDNSFKPDNPISIGEFASFLTRSFEFNLLPDEGFTSYKNLDKQASYYGDLIVLDSLGILNRVFPDKLDADRPITRLEVAELTNSALMAHRIIEDLNKQANLTESRIRNEINDNFSIIDNLSLDPNLLVFRDSYLIPKNSISSLITLYNSDIIKGYPDDTFRPDSNITRSESIVILLKARNIELTEKINDNTGNINEIKKVPSLEPKKDEKNTSKKIEVDKTGYKPIGDDILSQVPVLKGQIRKIEDKYYIRDFNDQPITRDMGLEGLVKIGEKFYLLNEDNSLSKDFLEIQGHSYYADGEKGLLKGWKQIGDHLYYFSPLNHRMYSNGVFSTGKGVYWFGPDGKIKTGHRPGGNRGKKFYWAYPTNEDLSNKWILEADDDLRFISQEMSNWASSKEGLPFKWYGVDLNDSSGVYCCGAVYSMLKEHGYQSADPASMNIRADGGYKMVKEQYQTAEKFGGQKIALNYKNMWPGDISFYYTPKSNYGYNHSAIFLGYNGGRPIIAHATLADGFVVENASIVTDRWGYRPLGAIRFVH